jgi:anti-anti-sigma factor
METGLAIDVLEVAGVADASCVALNGPLDARSVGAFKSAIGELQGRGVKRFILDLSEVKYVNSTGLSFLINLSESLGEGRTAVTLVGMQPKVKVIFDTMGVTDFFRAAPSVDAAAKALRAETAPKPPAPSKAAAAPRPKAPAPLKPPAPKARPPAPPPPEPPRRGIFSRFFRAILGRK